MGSYVKDITYCHHAYNLIGGHSGYCGKIFDGQRVNLFIRNLKRKENEK
jgi:hypothetical protein